MAARVYMACCKHERVGENLKVYIYILKCTVVYPRCRYPECKGTFTQCHKNMRHAACNKIVLCKKAYLCDMRLLHAIARKLNDFNFLATVDYTARF